MIEQNLCSARNLPTPPLDLVPKTNISQNKYICEICEREFYNSSSLNSHMESHLNSDPEVPFRCDVCGKCFSMPARLTRHYRMHTGEKPYNCNTCHKSFSVKENLSVHLRIHTQERPYQCSVCQRSFEHSGKLHRHMRIHTGERPHQCNICSKTFIQSGQLVIHMRTHTGEKPYICNTCEKGFTCSKQLKVHMRTHTGEKPYSCDICGKSFGYNHVLKLHQVAHFGEKVYKCTICKTTYSNKKHLEAHIKTHDKSFVDSPRHLSHSPMRPSSVGSSFSESSSSDKENSIFRSSMSPVIHSPISSPMYFNAPLAHSSMISNFMPTNPMDSQFILPSINTICPGDSNKLTSPISSKSSPQAIQEPAKFPMARISPIRKNPIYPITPMLVKTLLEEDLANYGPLTPLRTPPLSTEIYAGCIVTPPPSEPSLTPPPSVSPPTSLAMMTESSLPLRKRRLALSECSDFEDPLIKQEQERPGSADLSASRSSVICFATRT